MTGKHKKRWEDAGIQALGIHLPAPLCQSEQAAWRSRESSPSLTLPGGCAGGVKHPAGLFCFPVAPEDPSLGLRAGRFMGVWEGWGKRGRMSGCLLWGCPGDRVCSLGILVLSFGVSLSAQLLPFTTRGGRRTHEILTCSSALKATKFGEFLAFLIVGSVEEEVVG